MVSEADAFLAAIFAQPNDDTPRLVYADWLEEHEQASYAQFIRLSCQLVRTTLPPDDRTRLRRERYELWKRIVRENPQAFEGMYLDVSSFDGRGVLRPWIQVRADLFIRNSPHWWPVVQSRQLSLIEASALEPLITRCEYLQRVTVLECQGNYRATRWDERGREVLESDPVSAELLHGLADGRTAPRLTALAIDPIRVAVSDLTAFRESPLGGRLEEVRFVIRLADGSHEELRAGGRPGVVNDAIGEFLSVYRDQLPGG
jgi:uncharacterized protein (TIGR02996 family)